MCQNGCKDECKKYEFTPAAESQLNQIFDTFTEKKKPGILILATCFSEKSKVNELLSKYGLYASFKNSADMGKLTDGRITVLEKVRQYHGQATKISSEPAVSGEQEEFLSFNHVAQH